MAHKKHGRKKPYTDIGVKRLPCFRCGAPATQQWSVCSDNNLWHPLCTSCDIELNRLVLEFMGFPDIQNIIADYAIIVNS